MFIVKFELEADFDFNNINVEKMIKAHRGCAAHMKNEYGENVKIFVTDDAVLITIYQNDGKTKQKYYPVIGNVEESIY